MIAGIGTDIVRIERIKKALEKSTGEAFARRILTEAEMDVFSKHASPASYLAKRFAAKEAASKALGTGIGKVSFQHMEVTNDELGAPLLTFSGYARELQLQRGIHSLHLSLSDEQDAAVAFVVLES
ncbi:ACP synthase [Endozoicomonas montiporae]|uniref:Holo-[acyl-carrier-protein] synthase n=2 Tax=Endozoicomonas montiporae TaxID=1027273 RepID=A0A081NA96_9GAMM|nr:holo-ACP synthase [Endozoicomonas montiporae]AMO56947.1 4'-phosphopantetheinyl transferase [Endozoicomonas montiporae CL-33]KEQ15369.1 ACP synthase [Endozoicomonas montiporae]